MGPLSFPRFNGLSGVASVDYLEDGGEVFHLTFNSDLLLIEKQRIDYAVYSSPEEPIGKILLHLTFTQWHIFGYGGFNEETDDPEIVEIQDFPDWPLE